MTVPTNGFRVNQVQLIPLLGDIARLDVDALAVAAGISPQGMWLEIAPWVAGIDPDHIIEKVLGAHTSAKQGDVVITPGGRLKAKYLFHAVVVDYDRQHLSKHFVLEEMIEPAARRCIAIAVALGLHSIAFAPWGITATNADLARVTVILMHAITAQLQKLRGNLEIIYLIADQREQYQWFIDRAFVFHLLFAQVEQVRDVVKQLNISDPQKENLLGLLDNLHNNVVMYNEIVGGDKLTVGDITDATGIAIGKDSAADVNHLNRST